MIHICVIDREKCKAPGKCDYLCMKFCPVYKNNKEIFKISEDGKPILNEELCIGCGICVKKCPFRAISVVNLVKEPESLPVFQYGPNTFRLYRLPCPRQGEIVSIIGRNGMGKTTAIKILAGLLKPNFGKFDQKISEKEIINFFKGTELQTYFQKLYNSEVTLAYKPQEIQLFVKLYKDKTIKELLSKFDSNIVESFINRFNLKNILDRKVSQLSGGELQKLLILLTSLKNANVYLYDEPTAYLDIYERLNVALFLNEKINNNRDINITVIDHDLLFLDFLSNIVYIVYGIKGVYGVFSHPIGVKEGINQFLEGFLKKENLRIRNASIKLDIKSYSDIEPGDTLVSWSEFSVNLKNFRLFVEGGKIEKREIIGVIGRNGIGKTTFARVLVGEIKVENALDNTVEISYKPQYLNIPEALKSLSVNSFLLKLNPKFKQEFKEWLDDLGISNLLDNSLGNLSGGELQTVLTFGCLIQDKDLYVLDEPFAFLDVEQRLVLSKFIRENLKLREKSALIIEHDLLFVDYISDKIMVFLGEPGRFGKATKPLENKEALNIFLKEVNITVRRDPETKRPRVNKPGSVLDRQQREKGVFYSEA